MAEGYLIGKATIGEQAVYALLLRSEPHSVDETAGLRRALKTLLRQFAFRCVRVERGGGKAEVIGFEQTDRLRVRVH